MSQAQPLISDGKLVLFAVVGGIAAFAIVLLFVSGGLCGTLIFSFLKRRLLQSSSRT